jgi:hypothetical protein
MTTNLRPYLAHHLQAVHILILHHVLFRVLWLNLPLHRHEFFQSFGVQVRKHVILRRAVSPVCTIAAQSAFATNRTCPVSYKHGLTTFHWDLYLWIRR